MNVKDILSSGEEIINQKTSQDPPSDVEYRR